MSRFIDKLGIEGMIDRIVTMVRGNDVVYGLGMIFKSIFPGIISGSRQDSLALLFW
jgi:hypothetical protein